MQTLTQRIKDIPGVDRAREKMKLGGLESLNNKKTILREMKKGNDLRAILIRISKNNSSSVLKDIIRTASYGQMGINSSRYIGLQKERRVTRIKEII